ncbi:hypothetical protein NB713_003727 [Xanthomonas sacchari]|nr:hypothetical protein [Xanthomonas sacchari]
MVNSTAAGSGLPVDCSSTVGEVSSVSGGWLGSVLGTYSTTVACTRTELPTAASAGGALPV